ncbi:MAG TPA: DUF3857 and transglutaminase domain-containing protein [Gammaproteobacteria bacterium]
MKLGQVLFVLTTIVSSQLHAEEADAPDLASRYEKYAIEYQLDADGATVETREFASTVLKERAIEQLKETTISYSTSIQTLDILDAYTRKASGEHIDVPKNNFQVVVNKGKGKDAPVFSDRTRMTVVYPEVAVGDTVVIRYRLTDKEPMFPGKFSVANSFSTAYPYDEVTIKFDLPATLWAQYQAREMTEQISEADGRKVIEWKYQNKNPRKNKRRNFSVYDMESEPGYAFSTFRSYQEIAEAYGARALPKAVASERVRKLADEITGDAKESREQARLLYEWVAKNITYAGNCIGVGAVVPHDIDFILDNRMGDCKDHATLLQALLAAKEIDSIQALINAGSVYKLPRIPVVATVNHVINYLPGLELYVDSTSETTPFGMLPFSDIGKPVLWVENFKADSYTPVPPVGQNRQTMKTTIKIAEDGSMAGTVDVALQGFYAVAMRDRMRDLPKDVENEIVKKVFESQGYMATGRFEKEEAQALLDSYSYQASYDVKEYLQRPGAGAFAVGPIFFSQAPIAMFAQSAVEQTEEADVACSSGSSVEEYRIEFPKGMKIVSVPQNASFKNDFLAYKASYVLKGRTLTVRREIDDKTPGVTCSPAVQEAEKAFAKKLQNDLRAQVVYM